MHYMKWTRVILPIVFEEFEVVYIFFCYFFSQSLSVGKRSTLAKIWWGCCSPPPTQQSPGFRVSHSWNPPPPLPQ